MTEGGAINPADGGVVSRTARVLERIVKLPGEPFVAVLHHRVGAVLRHRVVVA